MSTSICCDNTQRWSHQTNEQGTMARNEKTLPKMESKAENCNGINNTTTEEPGFKMRKLMKFPIETLSDELVLEMIDKMEPNDIFELAFVSVGLRAFMAKNLWRIIGREVHSIEALGRRWYVRKFSTSPSRFEFPFHQLSAITAKLETCHVLKLEYVLNTLRQTEKEDLRQFFSRLRAIKRVQFGNVNFKANSRVFSNFSVNVTDSALIGIYGEWDNDVENALKSIIKTSLSECKIIDVWNGYPTFPRILSSFWTTNAKKIRFCWDAPRDMNEMLEAIERISFMGVPSQYEKAMIHLEAHPEKDDDYDGFLERFVKILHIRRVADKRDFKGALQAAGIDGSNKFQELLCFVKEIDGNKLFFLSAFDASIEQTINFFAGHLNKPQLRRI